MAEPIKPTSAAEKRRKSTFLFKASDQLIVRLRNMDMTTLVLNGLIPFPLLKAAQEYEAMQAGRQQATEQPPEFALADDEARAKKVMEESPGVIQGWNDFLKHYASVVAVEPRISVLQEDSVKDPSILWAGELEGDELIAILNATPDKAISEDGSPVQSTAAEQEVAPRLTDVTASDFRGGAQRNDDPPVADEPVLPLKAVRLDTPEREAIHA